MKTDLISVIINCHNGEKFLNECIQSVISQTYVNWEIIFWDNASMDSSKLIVDSFNDSRIKYFYNENLIPLYEARNNAIEQSKGQYICFLDCDDYWLKEKLELQYSTIIKNKTLVSYTNYYYLDQLKNKKFILHSSLSSGLITNNLLKKYKVGILTLMISKEIFQKHKFINKYNIIGDFEFIIRISQFYSFTAILQPLAVYRWHGLNETIKKRDIKFNELDDFYKNNKNKLSIFSNLKYLKRSIFYFRGQKYLINRQYKKLIKSFYFIGLNIYMVKLLILMIMPKFFINKLKKETDHQYD